MSRPWRERNQDDARFWSALVRLTELAVVVVDGDLAVKRASEGARRLLPAATGPLPSLVDPGYATIVASLIDRAVRAEGQAVRAVCAVPVDGTSPRRLELVARDLRSDPDVAGIAVTMFDVTGWAEREAEYRSSASRDQLTGLGNRNGLLVHLGQAVRSCSSDGPRVAVLMADVDGFKAVNDRYGHAEGDQLLRLIADRLVEAVGGCGSVYRLGGDEFVALLDRVSEEEAVHMAEAVLSAVRRPARMSTVIVPGAAEVLNVTVSIGVAMFDPDRRAGAAPEDVGNAMLRYADTAMYRAKAGGRGRVELFRPELHDWALMRKAHVETLADQVQKLKDENRALAEASSTDYRTGLANTATFDSDHAQVHARLARTGEPYSVFLADIDHFHDYNTAYGYLRGNSALAQVAVTLASSLRQGDRAYRYGGEEFAALLPGTRLDGAEVVAERARRAVEALGVEHPTNPGERVTVTIGVVEALASHAKATDVFQAVNALLLWGKDAGRNRVVTPRDAPPDTAW